jgi:hypothetical protein
MLAFLLAGCAASESVTSGAPRAVPEPKRLRSPGDLSYLRQRTSAPSTGRIIYIGVYGGSIPPWKRAQYFDPKHWPPYANALQEEDLNQIAFYESLMHVVAIQISRLFSDSITLMIRGDSEVLVDIIEYLYSPQDKVYLAGHSQGGTVIARAVYDLKQKGIPVQMTAQLEGFLSDVTVPSNVSRAFNFYVPSGFALCPGRTKIEAEAPSKTEVSNVAVTEPWGPFTGLCAEHRNIDSDPRVWKTILQYIIDSAGRP